MNYWPTARDILHSEIPTTIDKTVESLARRGRYILKNSLTVENMKSCILECRADKKLDTKPINASGNLFSFSKSFCFILQRHVLISIHKLKSETGYLLEQATSIDICCYQVLNRVVAAYATKGEPWQALRQFQPRIPFISQKVAFLFAKNPFLVKYGRIATIYGSLR